VNRIIRLVPGVLAAIAAYVALQLMHMLGIQPLVEFFLFVIIYTALAFLAERAMKSYAQRDL
jgi:membrane protein implicated in regulation of membrane protease activity